MKIKRWSKEKIEFAFWADLIFGFCFLAIGLVSLILYLIKADVMYAIAAVSCMMFYHFHENNADNYRIMIELRELMKDDH